MPHSYNLRNTYVRHCRAILLQSKAEEQLYTDKYCEYVCCCERLKDEIRKETDQSKRKVLLDALADGTHLMLLNGMRRVVAMENQRLMKEKLPKWCW